MGVYKFVFLLLSRYPSTYGWTKIYDRRNTFRHPESKYLIWTSSNGRISTHPHVVVFVHSAHLSACSETESSGKPMKVPLKRWGRAADFGVRAELREESYGILFELNLEYGMKDVDRMR